MNERDKQEEVRKQSPPDPQELLGGPFPAIYIVALSPQRSCSGAPGLGYRVSAETLLLIHCRYDLSAMLASDLLTVEERQRLSRFNCVMQVCLKMTRTVQRLSGLPDQGLKEEILTYTKIIRVLYYFNSI